MTDEKTAAQVDRILKESDRLPAGPAEDAAEVDPPNDRTRRFTHVNFSRMRTRWDKNDLTIIEEIRRQSDNLIFERFVQAYALIDQIYTAVRTPRVDEESGEVQLDRHGNKIWATNDQGVPHEDWNRVSDKERSAWIHQITTHLFEWEQDAATMWGEAMFAKGIWEEVFARGYTAPDRGTIDDRTQAGHLASMEKRYFAIFQSMISRRADAIVRSMERIGQRLKDTAAL